MNQISYRFAGFTDVLLKARNMLPVLEAYPTGVARHTDNQPIPFLLPVLSSVSM
jgi:hypothetical protein